MINTKAIGVELGRRESMKLLIEAYEEVAAIRMRKIRSGVLASRDFNLGLDKIYQNLLLSYKKQIDVLLKERHRHSDGLLMERNGKTVTIFLSANTGLYGDILRKTYLEFASSLKTHQTDIAIIGRFGKSMFLSDFPTTQLTYFDFPDTNVPPEMLSKFLAFILQYEHIYIYYSKFNSMSSQEPAFLDVFGNEEESIGENHDPHEKYLFEPSLETIMVFFEKEIFASIISQTIRESELAKYAARMITLDSSIQNVKRSLQKVRQQELLVKHREKNKKQLEALSAIRLIKLR